jgi:hypothetical protein
MREQHQIDLTGDFRTTIYSASRRLLDAGADQMDTIATYRNGGLSMSGVIGDLAKWTVSDPDKGGMKLSRWKAFPGAAMPPRTAESAFRVFGAKEARSHSWASRHGSK